MKSNSKRKNKATPSVKAHNVKKDVQRREAAAAKAREGSFAYNHPAAVALGKIWDGFDVPIEAVDVFLFWEKKDGVWVEVPDGSLLDKVDTQTKRYIGRRRDKKTGEWKPEERDVEVSKEAIGKAREKAEKTGKPIELPTPTSCEKFEVQFSPHHLAYANRKMAKIRAGILAVGGSKKEADKAADQWAIGVITRAVPKLGEYLEWRTGRRVFLTPLHTISGKWHLTPWTTYVGLDGRIEGLIQAGRGGRTIVGYESQLDAGYELPDYRLEIYKRKLATEKSRAKRYPDGRYVDVGLSNILLQHMRAEMEAAGDQDLWEEACAEYRAALEKAEPLKLELEKFKAEREAAYLDSVKEAGERKRELQIAGCQPALQERLQEVLDDASMRKLTAVYSLPRIAGLVVDKLVKIKELAAWAAESLGRLLRELARLFGEEDESPQGSGPQGAGSLRVVSNQTATEVVAATAIVEMTPPTPVLSYEDELVLEVWRKALAREGREAGPEFAMVIANVSAGREPGFGLTAKMFAAATAETVKLGVIHAPQVAVKPVAIASPPEPEKTQDSKGEAPLSVDWDESRDPDGELRWEFLCKMSKHPQLALLDESDKGVLSKLLVMGRVTWLEVRTTAEVYTRTADVLPAVLAKLEPEKGAQPEMVGPS
jgi:hypothetical protein